MVRLHHKTAVETCPNCHTDHELPIEHDEDGPYVDLDTECCNDDHCTARLCSSCDQFRCEMCGLTFCKEHEVVFEGESLCDECLVLAKPQAAEDALVGAAL